MNYGVLLASGKGARFGTDIPKQFFKIASYPIVILTLLKMLAVTQFDRVYIVINPGWVENFKKILIKFQIESNKIFVITGGKERLNSIENAINHIIKNEIITDDDTIVIHDAVRPFVSTNLLKCSILAAKEFKAAVASVAATDTMLIVKEKMQIEMIPDRTIIFHGQAPDSFQLNTLISALNKLTPDQRKTVTGTAQICFIAGIPVHTIPGEYSNIKITTQNDLKLAEYIYSVENEDESVCIGRSQQNSL